MGLLKLYTWLSKYSSKKEFYLGWTMIWLIGTSVILVVAVVLESSFLAWSGVVYGVVVLVGLLSGLARECYLCAKCSKFMKDLIKYLEEN